MRPNPPASVVAGNVETSMCIVNALYGALGVLAASQGTMNNFTYGTAARARVLLKRNDIAGKTGTTNESVDAWFSGYTPSLVATAWLGFDQPKSLGSRETGGGVAMPIWVDYMQTVLKGVPEEKPRPRPDGLLVENGEFYFSEFPPGQAVARLGLPEADTLGEFLNGLNGSTSEETRIKVAPGVGTQGNTPWSQKIPF
ncbi:hypothetical protein DAI43_10595 [Achromobacter xylosoxidans]|nr:hypothetical protein DAI43_10595 [Achromobacter xylosoxidans]